MEDDKSDPLNLSKIAEYLSENPIFNKNSQVVIYTLEYLILKQFKDKSKLTLDRLIEDLDLQSLINAVLNNLKTYNFVEFDGTNVSLHEDLLQSLKTDPMIKKPRHQEKLELSSLPKSTDAETPVSISKITRDKILRNMAKTDKPAPKLVKDKAIDALLDEVLGESLADVLGDAEMDSAPSSFSAIRDRIVRGIAKSDVPVPKMEKDKEIDALFEEVLGESLEDVLGVLREVKQKDPSIDIITPLVDLLESLGYVDETLNKENMMEMAEYQVLNTILDHHPISTEKLEGVIETEAPISIILSNLKTDGLIEQTNDSRWTLSKSTSKKLKNYADVKIKEIDDDPELEIIESLIKDQSIQFKEDLLDALLVQFKEALWKVESLH